MSNKIRLTPRQKYLIQKGSELKAMKIERRLTNKHICEVVDITEVTLSNILNGNQVYVSDDLLERIEKYLKSVKF